jgi:hypothetical protein
MRGHASAHARNQPSGETAGASERSTAEDPALELVDVPAAVVCASCGDPGCPGCLVEEPTHASGVVAVVPWERPGLTLLQRLWSTARLSTTTCESFFSALPDGEPMAALRFALLAELLAVSGLCIAATPVVFFGAPWLAHAIVTDAALRDWMLRLLGLGIPSVAAMMVAIHALHGLALDVGARRQGSRPRRARGLRFGLYACGWDLVTLPLGLALVAIMEGPRAALRAAPYGVTVPLRAARAYLRGVHQLDEGKAQRAARFAARAAGLAVVIGALSALAIFLL